MSDDLDDLIRRVDPDRWLSSRFIDDPAARADVIAIYAYDHELARAPKVASNALLGEIRLTWWREMLDEAYEGRPVRHHPTAQALARVISSRGLPREPLEAMIDARYRELDAAPMSGAEALAWARGTAGRAAEVAARILDPGGAAERAVAAGAVWALAHRGLALDPPETEAAKAGACAVSAAAFPAVAHAALAGRPAGSELAKRLRLTWAVARGRI
ncbi:squalene/phytoene synthase family protein [Phenylobacterium sp.]|uniref:squalene/phytoene synthase family protein n=1 Tax=Phenylobacterium sp. TaxID=1871053 RepID=UPI0025FF8C27|nr:squalene/phytoene synthase family protein [Phenylobacterium sp.]